MASTPERTARARLFAVLWLSGLAGVGSLLAIDWELLAQFLPPGTEVPAITPALKLLSLIQPALLTALAVFLGVRLASKVGLSSPVAEAVAGGGAPGAALAPQVLPGVCGGLVGGGAVVLTAAVFRPFLPPSVVARITEFGDLTPLSTRLLYGGITEELLLRWGLMTLLVWASWRLIQKARGAPRSGHFVGAIWISSLIFGALHLPITFLLVPEPGLVLCLFVILANTLFGLVAGFLYWRKGLESAVVAHMMTHVVLVTARHWGVYF